MGRAMLSRLPRLAIAAHSSKWSAANNRPVISRLLSTSRPPPPNLSPSSSDTSAVPSASDPPPPEVHVPPPDPQILTAEAQVAATSTGGATGAADAATDLAAEAASSSFSDVLLQPAISLLNGVHDITGLPWWLSIAASTFAIRSLLLPVTLMTMRNSARMTALKDDIAGRREKVMAAVRAGDRPRAAKEQTEMSAFMKTAGVTPLKVLAGPLAQFPVFISFFVGLRRLSQADPTFATGGVAWFSNLAIQDPTFVLPVVCGASLLVMTELGGDTGNTNVTREMRMGMRAIALLSVPMTYWFPSAVFCYWIPNNLFSVLLGAALKTKTTRELLGLNIDLKEIPGTRASKESAAKLAAQGAAPGMTMAMSPTARIASYAPSGAAQEVAARVVKPVLLKQKPSKKKSKSSSR